MLKRLIAISVVLLVIAGLLAWQLYVSAARFNAGNDLSKLQPPKDLKKQVGLEGGLAPLKPRHHYNPDEFGVIPAQNLFAETRTMQTELESPTAPPPPKLTVRPVLVGVAISGNKRLAFIIESKVPAAGQGPGGARRSQTKTVGDVYQGWTVVDITENQMVLASGDQKEIIPLFDVNKQRAPAGKTPVVATRVVSLGGGGTYGSGVRTAVAQPVGAAPGGPGIGTPVVVAPVASSGPASGVTGSQPAAARNAAQPQGVAQQPQPPQGSNERIDDQGRRVIRTPFGDIVRPEKPPN
ncbi:MAG: hypothetical protein DMG09_07430 [Acidobacteria bacterium]|nr:MAG: hypothetical protein DMG09_07430 [Acidobacteriota bacterium]